MGTAHSQESVSGYCQADRNMSFELTLTTLKLRSQNIDFEIPLEEGFFSAFLSQDDHYEYDFEPITALTEDSNYQYEVSLIEPDRVQNKSLRVTIQSHTQMVSKTWYNKFLGKWVGVEKLPTEKFEFYIAYRKTGRPSQMLMRVYNLSEDQSELEKILEQSCIIDTVSSEIDFPRN